MWVVASPSIRLDRKFVGGSRSSLSRLSRGPHLLTAFPRFAGRAQSGVSPPTASVSRAQPLVAEPRAGTTQRRRNADSAGPTASRKVVWKSASAARASSSGKQDRRRRLLSSSSPVNSLLFFPSFLARPSRGGSPLAS